MVVIGIISILIVLVVLAIGPTKRLADARNARRWADINNLLTATHEYIVDQEELPADLKINTPETEVGACVNCINLAGPLAPYLINLPKDVTNGTIQNTGYFIKINENSIITFSAKYAENEVQIQVSR